MSRASQHWKRAQERLAAQGKVLAPLANPEGKWTDEQHAAAETFLTAGLSLSDRIALLGQGACDCNAKSPDVHMHLPTCRYRRAMELADEAEAVSELLAAAEAIAALSAVPTKEGWRSMDSAPNAQDIIVIWDDGNIEIVKADDNDFDWTPYPGKTKGCSRPYGWLPVDFFPSTGGRL